MSLVKVDKGRYQVLVDCYVEEIYVIVGYIVLMTGKDGISYHVKLVSKNF